MTHLLFFVAIFATFPEETSMAYGYQASSPPYPVTFPEETTMAYGHRTALPTYATTPPGTFPRETSMAYGNQTASPTYAATPPGTFPRETSMAYGHRTASPTYAATPPVTFPEETTMAYGHQLAKQNNSATDPVLSIAAPTTQAMREPVFTAVHNKTVQKPTKARTTEKPIEPLFKCNEALMSNLAILCGADYAEDGKGWCGHKDKVLRCMEVKYKELHCEYTGNITSLIQTHIKRLCSEKYLPKGHEHEGDGLPMVVVPLVAACLLLLVSLEVARRTKPQARAATTALTFTAV